MNEDAECAYCGGTFTDAEWEERHYVDREHLPTPVAHDRCCQVCPKYDKENRP